MRHVGDLGNIMASTDGVAVVDIEDFHITLNDYSDSNVLDRAIVIHEGEDDLGLGGDAGSLATGNAGARVACGLILEKRPCKHYCFANSFSSIICFFTFQTRKPW